MRLRDLTTFIFVLAAGLASAGTPPFAQKKANDPSTCPYCKGDPAVMKKAASK